MDRSEKSGKYWEMILVLVPLAIMAMAFVLKSSDYTKLFALMFGFTVGYILEREYVSFEVIDRKILRNGEIIKNNGKRFAGPAGMTAAYSASQNGIDVVLVEKNQRVGC